MKASRDNKKIIYAIKFKDLPFPEIDKYVCVPYSWIIHRLTSRKVLAAYPKNEAPFVTRNRSKNRENYSGKWRFYIGFIKFKSVNYEDVVQWIEDMIAEGGNDNQEDEPEIPDPPAEPVESRQLRSAKKPVLSGTLPNNPRRPLPRLLIRRPLPLRPWKPKPIEPSNTAVSSANAPSKDQPVVENLMLQNTVNDISQNPVLSGTLPDKPRRPLPRLLIRPPLPLRPWKPQPIGPSKPAVSSVSAPLKDQPVVENLTMQNPVNDLSQNPVLSGTQPEKSQRPLPRLLIRPPLTSRPWKLEPIGLSKLAVSSVNSPLKDQPVVENLTMQNPVNDHSQNPVLSGTQPEKSQRPLPIPLIRPPQPLTPWTPNPIGSSEPAVSSVNSPLKDQPGVENLMMQNAVNGLSQQESVDTSVQSPPKLPAHKEPLPMPADGRQPPPVQDEQLPGNDDSDIEIVVDSEPPISEQTPSDLDSDPNYSLIELQLNEIHNGPQQTNNTLKSLLVQNSTARLPSRANQPHDYSQPVSTPPSKSQLQGLIGSSSGMAQSYQKTQLQGLVKTVPSTTYNTPTPIDLSPQPQIPPIKRKAPVEIKKPAEKKARAESITKNIRTSQQSLYNKQPPYYAGNVGDQSHLQSINTSAAQSLSNLAHQAHIYNPLQLQYLQQIARMQDMINRPNMPYIDQRSYLPNIMSGYVLHQPNQIDHSQFLPPQNQRPMVSTNQIPELMRHVTTPLVAVPLRQDPPSYQDPRIVKPLEPQSNPTLQVAERLVSSPETNHQVSDDRRNNSRINRLARLSLGPMNCTEIVEEPATCPDSETQSSESQETQSKVPEKNVYKHPVSKKLVVDQATEIESDNRHDDEAASPSQSLESGYETEKRPTKQQESLKVPDSEMIYDNDELSDNLSTDGSDCANEDFSEEDTLASITGERLTDTRNLMPEVQEELSKLPEDELLEVHGLLLTKMYQHFVDTEGYYNNLRVSTMGCLKLYETLLNKSKEVNVVESLTNPTSEAPEVPQVQETPAPAPAQNPTSDENVNSSVINSPTKSKRRLTFVLPPEYDPDDSRWTLKHPELGPKLMHLMPSSRVYVSKNEFKKCIRSSYDCRTLTRSLLTAVFSKNALSVCSPTGAKARAFNNANIDVRPGLDKDSMLALLAFIDKHGKENRWTSDTAGVMSSIRSKIQDMRKKYGKTKFV